MECRHTALEQIQISIPFLLASFGQNEANFIYIVDFILDLIGLHYIYSPKSNTDKILITIFNKRLNLDILIYWLLTWYHCCLSMFISLS